MEQESSEQKETKEFSLDDVMPRFDDIDYNVGDILVSKTNRNKEIGICTGFRHNDKCVDINGKCWGGRTFFMKSEFINCEIINDA